MPYRLFLFFFGLLAPFFLQGQAVVGEVKLKKYSTEGFELYPYDFLDPYGKTVYIAHDPSVKVSEGEVVQIWQPDRGSYRDRILRKYNILMEMIWEKEFELDREEEILHFFKVDTTVILLTTITDYTQNQHVVKAHKFGLTSGEIVQTDIWWIVSAQDDNGIHFDLAPDGKSLLCYYFAHERNNRNVALYYDHVRRDDQAGYRATAVHRVHFIVMTKDGSKIEEGFLEPNNRKLTLLNCQVDNQANVYITAYEKPESIKVFQWNAKRKEQQELIYQEAFPFHELREPYTTHFPPTVGLGEKLFIAFSDRVKRGKGKGTKAFSIVAFDFEKGKVDVSRRLEINSTFQVMVEKQREAYGLKPVPRFDEFMIREIIQMEDSSLWLITQKYNFHSMAGANYASPDIGPADQKMEELILYEFSPEGKARQAIVIPTMQYIQSMAERVGQFYDMEVDKQERIIQLITREPSGEKLKGPDRIYYRKIDLNTREISDRLQIYQGKRRDQYLLKAYVEWINPAIVSFLMIDGDSGNAYNVAINVEMAPIEEEESSKKKPFPQEKQIRRAIVARHRLAVRETLF